MRLLKNYAYFNDESEYNNFKSHFRILRSMFNQLLSILHQHPNYASTPFQPQIPLEIQVGVVIQLVSVKDQSHILPNASLRPFWTLYNM